MYKEIEELEEQMKNGGRKPASQQMDNLFELPKAASSWDDPTDSTLFDPTKNREAGSVVGAIDPDYSGFEELAKKRRPVRDTSTADLIAMGLSTGLGAMFGQTGVAAKVAGEYGLDRFNKAEKRDQSYDDLLNKIELAKAQTMAKGRKGTKIGGGVANADDPTKNRYLGADGFLHTPTRKKADGTWAKLESDNIYDKPTTKVFSLDTPDGGKVNVVTNGRNQGTSMGSLNAQSKLVPNAKGEMVVINDRTIGDKGLPEDFNKTNIGTNKAAKADFDEIQKTAGTDGYLARYQQADSDLRAASAALGSDGDLDPIFLLTAQRFLGMGMDKGRSLTNDEFAKVEGVNTGLVDKMRNTLIGYKKGRVGSDEVRKQYRRLTALLGNNVAELRNSRIADYNKQMKSRMGDQFQEDKHGIPSVKSGVSGKTQEKDVKKLDKTANELRSDKSIVVPHPTDKRKDGTKRKVRMGYNPQTKKYDRYIGEE